MVEILIAAVIGGLVGAFGTAAWLRRSGKHDPTRPARERRSGGTAATLQRSILDSLQDGVVVYDEDDRIVFFNPAAAEILGVSEQSLSTGVRTWEPLDAEGRAVADEQRPVEITARTGEPCVGIDIGLRVSSGDLRWTTVSTRALHEQPADNGRYAVVAAFTDITERREAQRALERTNAELAQFAYVASHDLSEPLRMVSSYLQLLRRRYHGQIDEDADEFIDFAVEGANRMRALIEDLLAYSRAGRGADPRAIDLGHVMADVLSSLAAAVADARAQVSVGPMPTVLGDRLALAQVLQNLIANALKFRSGPQACVWVSAERVHDAKWRVTVADDGIGIDPRHRDRVFKMFQRLHDREAFEGTGIGLAICRKIVERQGGEIWVDGREGGGSVFSFTIPAVPTPALVDPTTGEGRRIGTPVA
ncbi:MAG TPA: ATP-binding protein [Solirubrobacteraceae bacterium]|nr:ATP-binding protein [Solirubrobacteraceae bacterium]